MDDAVTNPNALAARNLMRLAVVTGDDAYLARLDHLFDGLLPRVAPTLYSHAGLLNALDTRLRAPPDRRGRAQGEAADALLAAAFRLPRVDVVVQRVSDPAALPAGHPAREKAEAVDGVAAFVCEGTVCSLPVTEPNRLIEVATSGLV